MNEIELTEIERRAVLLLADGGSVSAVQARDEVGAMFDDGAATQLTAAMADAVRDNPESFLTWFQSTSGEVEI